MRPPDDAAIRRYLLGLLPPAEAEALEESYFADPELFYRVRGFEDDLIDDYAAGRLDAADGAAFEARYRASEPLRQRVTAARALRTAVASAGAAPPVRTFRWLGPLTIAAALAVAVAVVFAMRSRGSQAVGSPPPSLARSETAPPPPGGSPGESPSAAASPTPAPLSGRRVLLALSPTLLRGEGGAVEARIPPRSEWLVLHLQLQPSEIEGVTALQAVVETVEGARVWSGPAQQVQEHENLAAEVVVPAARVPAGDYLVTLSAGSEVLHRYFFRVLGS